MEQKDAFRIRVLCSTALLFSSGALPLAAQAQPPNGRARIVERSVHRFDVEGLSMLDALLHLGQQEHLALGIEYLDPADLGKPVALHLGEASVGHIIQAILDQRSGYTWNVGDDVVNIGHEGLPSGDANLLEHVLRRFVTAGRTDLITATTLMLPGQLRRELSPSQVSSGVSAIYGSVLGGTSGDQVGPLELENVTVRQVLNRLVSQRNNAAWVVLVPPRGIDRLPPHGRWYIIEYDPAQTHWTGFIERLLRENWQPAAAPRPTKE
jgi:hypothetical protein